MVQSVRMNAYRMVNFAFGEKLDVRAPDKTFDYGAANGEFDSHFSTEKVMVRVTLPKF
jgi:hypothetical protein